MAMNSLRSSAGKRPPPRPTGALNALLYRAEQDAPLEQKLPYRHDPDNPPDLTGAVQTLPDRYSGNQSNWSEAEQLLGAQGASQPNALLTPSAPASTPGRSMVTPEMLEPLGPRPAPKQPGKLAQGVAAFAQGFAPEAYNRGFDRAQQQTADAHKQRQEAAISMLSNMRNWTAKALEIEDDAQMAEFVKKNAANIRATTGQDITPILQQGISREKMRQDLAEIDAALGNVAKPQEPYTLAPGAQRYDGSGQLIAENPRADKPEAPPNWQVRESGGVLWAFNPQTREVEPVRSPTGEHLTADKKDGIQLEFGEDGSIVGLTIGGSAPKGKDSAVVRGPDGRPVVTPGPQQLAANKAYQSLQDFGAQNSIVMDEIRRAKGLVGPWTTGAGASLANIPIVGRSTDAGALQSRINTIKANVGFDKLQNMRENSPTGGALGNVTEKEIAFLQAVFGDLETAQRQEDVEYNLNRLEQFMQGREARLQAAFAQDYPELAQYAGFARETTRQMQDIAQSGDPGESYVNPQTGEEIRYNAQTNQWEPVR